MFAENGNGGHSSLFDVGGDAPGFSIFLKMIDELPDKIISLCRSIKSFLFLFVPIVSSVFSVLC